MPYVHWPTNMATANKDKCVDELLFKEALMHVFFFFSFIHHITNVCIGIMPGRKKILDPFTVPHFSPILLFRKWVRL